MASNKVYVVGVGMTKFEKPGSKDWDYPDMARRPAPRRSRTRASPTTRSSRPRRLRLRRLDLRSARGLRARPDRHPDHQRQQQLLDRLDGALPRRPGHPRRSLRLHARARLREDAAGLARSQFDDRDEPDDGPPHGARRAPGVRDAARAVHVRRRRPRAHGALRHDAEHFAKIGYKNHKHSVNNPYAQFQKEYTLEEIQNAPMIYSPLTKLQCSPTSDGSGAVILASEASWRSTASATRPSR
jgi:acetyl-CoA acyltransferase